MTGLRVVVTGAGGFIGRNLCVKLDELGHRAMPLLRESTDAQWARAIAEADAVVHLAGANRPPDPAEFAGVNVGSARLLVETLEKAGQSLSVIYSSSIRAQGNDDYGASKRAGEDVLLAYAERSGSSVHVFRLPNVFGKWARPNYNSAVATFCHNIARGMPVAVHEPAAPLRLVYVDDVVRSFVEILENGAEPGFAAVQPVYEITVGEVVDAIRGFRDDRGENFIDEVGVGFTRALYATYVAAMPPEEFSYPIVSHSDHRGTFSEMLKTRTSGQFSYFTAFPGVTRGGHYHHTKTEKFLIVHGQARFRFRHIVTGEQHEIVTTGDEPRVVETVPGWTHDVTNIGDETMISLLWANEVFDRDRPDTIAAEV